MYVPHMYVCACRGQKREWDPLELELWIILNLQMSAGNQTQVPCRSSKSNALNHCAISAILILVFYLGSFGRATNAPNHRAIPLNIIL